MVATMKRMMKRALTESSGIKLILTVRTYMLSSFNHTMHTAG